jgi:hypothetical protein
MSLLLNGAKTITIAGTEMSCIEIYTGEAYTFPFQFSDSVGNPINTTGWTLGTSAKYYVADTVAYNITDTQITIGNLTLTSPQPSTGAGTYSANLTATFTTPSGTASAVTNIAFPTATIPAASVSTTRIIKEFTILSGTWTHVSDTILPP